MDRGGNRYDQPLRGPERKLKAEDRGNLVRAKLGCRKKPFHL